ncbi:piercer of microtubule wall 1 protein [Mantella aurantiaca]
MADTPPVHFSSEGPETSYPQTSDLYRRDGMADISSEGPETSYPQTSDLYRVQPHLPDKFNHPETWRPGYRTKPGNPLYRTTNQSYGSRPPTVHEMPTRFKGVSNKFSDAATKCGMYRDNGLNTHIEKSYVTGPDNLITFQDRLNFHRSYNVSGPSHSA